MFIPLRTDRPLKRQPLVTELLIVTNMLVFLIGLMGNVFGSFDQEAMIAVGRLDPDALRPWTFITYQFLHAPDNLFHIAFNMLFLWVFGGAVESRLGRPGFLAFYLIGGAVCGLAHLAVSPNPVIGASGSVSCVTGAFLALFPRSRILLFVFFFIIGVVSIPALWFIGFYFAIDVLRFTSELLGRQGAPVAYMAHLAGYVYGFTIAFGLLATSVLKRDEFDAFYLYRQWRRRSAFRAASRGQTGGMFESASADTPKQIERQTKKEKPRELTEEEKRIATARSEIVRLMQEGEFDAAATEYRRLLDEAPLTVLTETLQMDMANHLYATGDLEYAAQTYELLLNSYTARTHAEVKLLLGLMYARHLNRPRRARELLKQAKEVLREPAQHSLADELLAEVGEVGTEASA